ncbi:MAG: PPC domain-containing protein, partial [Proteobacteria bacterium]|nr:PPC domain-containing protein [Pseudomonadota bacterium]
PLHPADILALLPGDVSEPPPPTPAVAVSGNDAFADGWIISPPLPFFGEQSTVGSTEETGEPSLCGAMGSTVWFRFTPDESETLIIDTVGSDFDTVLAAFTGSAVDALSPVACNDDTGGLQSQISFPVTAGTTYHVQAGGFNGQTGDLVLNVRPEVVSSGNDEMAPFVRIACADLGLTADGCDDGSDGDQDDLDALSYGADLPVDAQPMLNFSVGPGAQGVAGSAVEEQRNCPPVQPGLSPEPEPDEFGSVLDGTNELVLDGNGPIGACTPAFPLGFIEGATVRDDLDALYGQDPAAVDADNDGVPESPVYFSLDADSPSLTTLGFSAADILTTVSGGPPTVFASEAELGLVLGDDVDALCLRESGDSIYAAGVDLLYFSLAPGSPSLSQMGAGPGDLLTPDGPSPIVAQGRAYLGLIAGDDVDALKCQALSKDPRLLGSRVQIEYQVGEFFEGDVHLERLLEVMRLTQPGPTLTYGYPAIVIPMAAWTSGMPNRLDVAESAGESVLAAPAAIPFVACMARVGLAMLAIIRGSAEAAKKQYGSLELQRGMMLPMPMVAERAADRA